MKVHKWDDGDVLLYLAVGMIPGQSRDAVVRQIQILLQRDAQLLDYLEGRAFA